MAEEIIIEAGRSEAHYWRDLWRFRELFGFLAWRDILVRYKQTAIGIVWAVLRPLLVMFVGVFFRRVTNMGTESPVPNDLFVLAALLPWQFFANALSESSNSLVGNANLISKIYFPRMILPASAVIVALVDFAITLGIMAVVMIWHQYCPPLRVFALPFFVLLALIAALGPGLLVTALNVKYRDFRYVIPFIVQFGLFVSPVFFSSEELGTKGGLAHLLVSLNPMTGVIDGFRWCLGVSQTLYLPTFLLSCGLGVIFLILGVWLFRKTERTFADII